jgi:hypothetical protein
VTPQSEAEAVDFKPFFDLIIGVLFIFLILIAAQIFFTQWAPTHDQTRNWEAEISRFFEKLAGGLRQVGLTASVDSENRTISVLLEELVGAASDGGPRILNEPTTAFGRVLDAHLGCVSRVDTHRTDCPDLRLELRQVHGEVRVNGLPAKMRLPQDRYARLVAIELTAGIFRGTPQLLGFTGSNGRSVIDVASAIAAAPKHEGLKGDVALRFTFDPPRGIAQ